VLHTRARAYAATGMWKEALADLRPLVEPPYSRAPTETVAEYALVLLQLGDAKGYSQTCQRLLQEFRTPENEPKSTIVSSEFGRQEVYQFGRAFDPRAAASGVWVCCLSSQALPDWKPLVQVAQNAAAKMPQDYIAARSWGAALHRAGQWEEARKRLEATGALRPQPSPSVWLYLAMTLHRQGQTEKAKEWLAKTRAWMEQSRQTKPGNGNPNEVSWDRLLWSERLALEMLEREAGQLIEDGPPKK
jgi:tetratricopeptide (TPR) repeat protein